MFRISFRTRIVVIFTLIAAVVVFASVKFGPGSQAQDRKGSPEAPQAAVVTATLTDNVTAATKVAPGGTITYTATITNAGAASPADDALNVIFTDTLDANTTLVPGSLMVPPIANPDAAYTAAGNVRISVNAASGVLANDINPGGGSFTASAGPTSAQGGNVVMSADGSFTYNPPPGFTGTDTFTYTATGLGGATANATVTFNVSGMIWFVQTGAPAGGDGRLTNPFNCYTGAGCFSAVAADDPGDNIFLYSGAYLGGNTLLANQRLIGQGATASLSTITGITPPTGSDALPATGGARPTMTTTVAATSAITLGSGNTLRGFNIGDTTAVDIAGTGFGTLTASEMDLTGTGRPLSLTTGTLAATFGTLTSTSSPGGAGIGLSGVGGTLTVTGAVSITGASTNGISISGSTLNSTFGSTTVATSTTEGIVIGTHTVGTLAFGNTSVTGGTIGVSFQNNASGSRTFGTLGVSGGSGNAFLSVAGGDVTVNALATLTTAAPSNIDISNLAVGTQVQFNGGATLTKTAAGNFGVNISNCAGNVTFGGTLTAGTSGSRFPTAAINVLTGTGSFVFGTMSIFTNGFTGISTTTDGTLNTGNGTVDVNAATVLNVAGPVGLANLGVTLTTITSTGGTNGVNLTNATGTVNLNGGTLTGSATGATFLVSGGTVNVSQLASVTQATAGQPTVSVTGGHTGILNFQTGTVSATGGPGLQFDNADGNYQFNGTTTLNGGDAGVDIVNGSAATFIFSANTTITNPSGIAYREDTSTSNVTYNGTITKTNNANHAVDINAKTGGTTAFNRPTGGQITATTTTANAIDLTNTGGTVTFTGGLAITTTTGVGLNATGAGATVNATQNNTTILNTISSGTGTGLNVVNTSIGASGLTFRSIAASGGANGIILNNTGTTAGTHGGLTVTGTATTDGSGGIIQNTTGRGASFITARSVSLSNMTFTNAGTTDLDATNAGLSTGDNLDTNAAIHLVTVPGSTALTNVDITGGAEQGINGNTVANFSLVNSTITNVGNAADEDNIHFFNMSGTSAITGTTLTHTAGGGDDNMNLQTQAGTLNLTISGSSAVGVAGGVNQLGSGFLFGIRGTTNSTITFNNSAGAVSSTNNFSGGLVADVFDSATMALNVSNFTSSGNNDQLSVSAGDNSNVDLNVSNCTLSSVATGDFVVISLLGSAFDNGFTFDARIQNNNITVANGLPADGFLAFNAGGGFMNMAITGNTFDYAGTQRAIAIQGGQDGAAKVNATVTGNNIDVKLDGAGNATTAIFAQVSVASPSGDNSEMCADIGGATAALRNTVTHSIGGANMPAGDMRMRQRFDSIVRLPGYTGAAADEVAVQTYLQGRNTLVNVPQTTVTNGIDAGEPGASGMTNTPGPGNPCTQPNPMPPPGGDDLAFLGANGVAGNDLLALLNAERPADVAKAPGISEIASASVEMPFWASIMPSADSIKASGDSNKASGDSNKASGDSIMPSGDSIKASGNSIKASGDSIMASGNSIKASGDSIMASAESIKAEGFGIKAEGFAEMAPADVAKAPVESEKASALFAMVSAIGEMISPTVYAEEPAKAGTHSAPFSGETITVNGGGAGFTLPAGKTVTIQYQATVNFPPQVKSVTTQGTVTGNGPGAFNIQTDDPEPAGGPQATATLVDTLMTWDGSTSTDWNTATNWTPPAGGVEYAPGVSNPAINDVVIPNVGLQPSITASDITVYSLIVNNGRTLTITSPRVLTIGGSPGGNLQLDGIISGGNLNLGTGTHTITNAGGTGSLSSTNVATILSGGSVTLAQNLQAGALALNAGGVLNLTNRTVSLNGVGGLNVQAGSTFTTTGSTVIFNGSGAVPQSLGAVTLNNMSVNNTGAGVSLTGSPTVNATFSLIQGNVTTGAANTLIVASGGTANRAAGAVLGKVQKVVVGGAIAPEAPQAIFLFPVGTATGYSPVTANFTAASNGNLTVEAFDLTMPAVPALNDATTLDRHWQMTEGGTLTADLTLQYLPADVDGTETNYRLIRGTGGVATVFPNNCPGTCVNPAADTITAVGATSFDSFWTAGEPLAPTAANVGVSGRVYNSTGRGVAGAIVRMTDQGGNTVYALTNPFGYYHFDGVASGQDYVMTVTSKQHTFAARLVSVSDSITDLDFIAEAKE
jgi:hypothetical protein